MASTVDLKKFVSAARAELDDLVADYAETARTYRGARGAEAERRVQQIKGVNEGIAEARKAMSRALKNVLESTA